MSESDPTTALHAFLAELTELTKKYQIEIGGCGCDGSPWLSRLDDPTGKAIANDLEFEGCQYVVDGPRKRAEAWRASEEGQAYLAKVKEENEKAGTH